MHFICFFFPPATYNFFCDVCNFPGRCTHMPSPTKGSFKIVAGNGASVGTVMILECFPRYRAISGGRISCVQENNVAQWNGGIPECKGETYVNHYTVHLLTRISDHSYWCTNDNHTQYSPVLGKFL